MHHSAHIGLAMLPIATGAPAVSLRPISKGVAAGQFLHALLATGQPTATEKQTPKAPCDGNSGEAIPGGKAKVVPEPEASRDAEVSQNAGTTIHAEVSTEPHAEPAIAIATTKSPVSPKLVEASLTPPAAGTCAPRKSLHKDSVVSAPGPTEVAPAVAPMVAPAPVALSAKADVGAMMPNELSIPEPFTESADPGPVSAKGIGGVAAVKSKSKEAEVKKLDSSVPTTAHATLPDIAHQISPAVTLVASHDVEHTGRDIPLQGSLVGVISAVPSSAPHPASVAKASGGSSSQIEIGSQATDLKTLVATPNVLEVGIASGSHGWLKVRAEFAQTGEVAASVVASSASAAQSLHKELPGISAYLAGERVGVSSLVVNSAERSAGTQDSVLNDGAGGTASASSGSHRRGKDGAGDVAKASSPDSNDEVDASFLLGAVGATMPSVLHGNGSGSWLSVRV